MANEQYAFLQKSAVPTRDQWQAAIDACGFDFQLAAELEPFEDSGFLPCTLYGSDAGFEIYYDGSPELLNEFSDLAQGCDFCISFRWGGSMAQCASVMIASYALAKTFGAIVSYEGEEPSDPETLRSETMACIKHVKPGGPMRTGHVYKLARKLFSEVLEGHGFTSTGSRRSTFWRKVSDELYHIVEPDAYGGSLRVRLYPTTPVVYPDFDQKFPDSTWMPMAACERLGEHEGVGRVPFTFNCENEQRLRCEFAERVKPPLTKYGLPYLDRIRNLSDVAQLLKGHADIGWFLGLILKHLGKTDQARKALLDHRRELIRRKELCAEIPAPPPAELTEGLEHVDALLAELG